MLVRTGDGGTNQECRERADDEVDGGRARWIVASIVVLVWVVLGVLVIATLTNWM